MEGLGDGRFLYSKLVVSEGYHGGTIPSRSVPVHLDTYAFYEMELRDSLFSIMSSLPPPRCRFKNP